MQVNDDNENKRNHPREHETHRRKNSPGSGRFLGRISHSAGLLVPVCLSPCQADDPTPSHILAVGYSLR